MDKNNPIAWRYWCYGGWTYTENKPETEPNEPVYSAADHDALRSEVQRLREECRERQRLLAEQAQNVLEQVAYGTQQFMRAEAAEARATTAMNLTDTWRRRAHELRYNPAAMPFAAECIEDCAKQLDSALNAQGDVS